MDTKTITVRKVTNELNNKDGTNGGFWLPNIQRNFVWKEAQIEQLFDSLMRVYPIGTLLIWKTKDEIKLRKFIECYKKDTDFKTLHIPPNKNTKLLVIDGQQRLQGLFIGLMGSYNGKELYFNVLSGEKRDKSIDDIRYIFKFKEKTDDATWIKFKDIVMTQDDVCACVKKITTQIENIRKMKLSESDHDHLYINISNVHNAFMSADRIVYQECDSVDKPNLYNEDDVVEIFIRANSSGTELGKSDLLFSLLTASWQEAEEKVDDLLNSLNKGGYKFTKDFILKTCLALLNQQASYKVEKFRKKNVKDDMVSKWDGMTKSIKVVRDFLYDNTYLKSDSTMRSYLALIPLIYFHYHFEDQWKPAIFNNISKYILKTKLSGAFSGSPDTMIDNCISIIKETKGFNYKKICQAIRSKRTLEITSDELLKLGYSKQTDKSNIHVIFNFWYSHLNYNPSYNGNQLNIDHIFPKSKLKQIKRDNEPSMQKYHNVDIDQIANLMLLTMDENGAGGKNNKEPYEWFKNKDDNYFKKHLIPDNIDLLKLENFELFITERKELIKKRCNDFGLLQQPTKREK